MQSSNDYTGNSITELYLYGTKAIKYIKRNLWLVLLVAILFGALGVLKAWWQKARYEARVTFALYEGGDMVSGAISLAAEFGINLGGSGQGVFSGENIIGIITSRRIIENVLLQKDTLDGKVYTMAEEYRQMERLKTKYNGVEVTFPPNQPRETFTYLQDSMLYNMYSKIVKTELQASKPDRKMNLFEVRFESLNERFSKRFTEVLLKEVNSFYTDIRSKRSRQTLAILENRVAQVKQSLGGAIDQRSSLRDANINPAFAVAEAQLQRKQVDITTYGAAYVELFKNLELARYQYLKDIPLLQMIDEPRYPLKKIKNGRLFSGLLFAFVGGVIATIFLFMRLFLGKLKRMSKAGEPITNKVGA